MSGNLIRMEQAAELYNAVKDVIENTEEFTKELTDGPSENPPADALDIMWKSAGYAVDAYMGYKTIKTLFPATMSKVTAAVKADVYKRQDLHPAGEPDRALRTDGADSAAVFRRHRAARCV